MSGVQPPQLVASDVDGTLLDGTDRVSPRTRAAIEAVRARGVPFVLVTGRPPRWIAPVVDQLGFAPMAVCANGAVLYDPATDEVVSAQLLPVELLREVADVAERLLPGCGLAAERVGRSAHDDATPQFVAAPGYVHAWLNPDDVEVEDHLVLAEPAVKLLVRHPEMTSGSMAAALRVELDGLVDLTWSTDNGLVELAAPGVTKASGLSAVAHTLAVPASHVVAFGDMPNDVPMLRWAGLGVAMGNAHPDALAVADEVAPPNTQDGVAQVLERWWS
ncbi:HAD family hydrolase [Rhodococcus antarcticus]|uniref:HAD family hydrolase n=1 Tax=Rhodococcus antarcticus TaxID=2987751 RepID=UPI003F49B0A5